MAGYLCPAAAAGGRDGLPPAGGKIPPLRLRPGPVFVVQLLRRLFLLHLYPAELYHLLCNLLAGLEEFPAPVPAHRHLHRNWRGDCCGAPDPHHEGHGDDLFHDTQGIQSSGPEYRRGRLRQRRRGTECLLRAAEGDHPRCDLRLP